MGAAHCEGLKMLPSELHLEFCVKLSVKWWKQFYWNYFCAHLWATALDALKINAPQIVAQFSAALLALLVLRLALGLRHLGKL